MSARVSTVIVCDACGRELHTLEGPAVSATDCPRCGHGHGSTPCPEWGQP